MIGMIGTTGIIWMKMKIIGCDHTKKTPGKVGGFLLPLSYVLLFPLTLTPEIPGKSARHPPKWLRLDFVALGSCAPQRK